MNDSLYTIILSPDSFANMPSFPSDTPHKNGSLNPRFITNSIIVVSFLMIII